MKKKSMLRLVLGSYGNMALATVLCLIVTVSVAVFPIPKLLLGLLMLLLVLPLYTALLYSPVWTEGDRNRNMVQFGHLEKDIYRGVKIGAFLIIPYAIEDVFLTLSWAKVIPNIFPIYKLLNAHIWPILEWVNPLGDGIVNASDMSLIGLIICWLLALYPMLVTTVAYILGYKGISISEKLIYKNKPHKKRRY